MLTNEVRSSVFAVAATLRLSRASAVPQPCCRSRSRALSSIYRARTHTKPCPSRAQAVPEVYNLAPTMAPHVELQKFEQGFYLQELGGAEGI